MAGASGKMMEYIYPSVWKARSKVVDLYYFARPIKIRPSWSLGRTWRPGILVVIPGVPLPNLAIFCVFLRKTLKNTVLAPKMTQNREKSKKCQFPPPAKI